VEKALAKVFGYLLISGLMLYILGKFFLWILNTTKGSPVKNP
jgi:hypothetical protein